MSWLIVTRPRKRGRFLLTGSANLLLMRAVADSLAGRAAYRTLHPLTRREQLGLGRAGRWGDLLGEDVARWPTLLADDDAGPEDWTALAKRGGLPVPALELPHDAARATWFEGYVRTWLERDLRDLANIQSLPDFRRLMRAAALRTGSLLSQAELGRDVAPARLDRPAPPGVARDLPPARPPRAVLGEQDEAADQGAQALLDRRGARVAPRRRSAHWSPPREPRRQRPPRLGRRPEGPPSADPALAHRVGQEADAVIEHQDRLVAVEVKTTTRPGPADARHLRAFREEYGDAVAGCLLLHGGTEIFRLSEGIVAAPWWRVL